MSAQTGPQLYLNPPGSCMPDEKTERLCRLLVEFDVTAIEDDIDGGLHCGERRPKPLKAGDSNGRVLPCSFIGKTLAAGLRTA